VSVQVNGKPDTPWRINLMPVGDGDFFLYLHGQVRKASGTSVGDVVSITLAFDDEYKGGPGPSNAPLVRSRTGSKSEGKEGMGRPHAQPPERRSWRYCRAA